MLIKLKKHKLIILGILSVFSTSIIFSKRNTQLIKGNNNFTNISVQKPKDNNFYKNYYKEIESISYEINTLKNATIRNNLILKKSNMLFNHNINYINVQKKKIRNKINFSNLTITYELDNLYDIKNIITNHPYDYIPIIKEHNYSIPNIYLENNIKNSNAQNNIRTNTYKMYNCSVNINSISYQSEEDTASIRSTISFVSSLKILTIYKVNFNNYNILYFSHDVNNLTTLDKYHRNNYQRINNNLNTNNKFINDKKISNKGTPLSSNNSIKYLKNKQYIFITPIFIIGLVGVIYMVFGKSKWRQKYINNHKKFKNNPNKLPELELEPLNSNGKNKGEKKASNNDETKSKVNQDTDNPESLSKLNNVSNSPWEDDSSNNIQSADVSKANGLYEYHGQIDESSEPSQLIADIKDRRYPVNEHDNLAKDPISGILESIKSLESFLVTPLDRNSASHPSNSNYQHESLSESVINQPLSFEPSSSNDFSSSSDSNFDSYSGGLVQLIQHIITQDDDNISDDNSDINQTKIMDTHDNHSSEPIYTHDSHLRTDCCNDGLISDDGLISADSFNDSQSVLNISWYSQTHWLEITYHGEYYVIQNDEYPKNIGVRIMQHKLLNKSHTPINPIHYSKNYKTDESGSSLIDSNIPNELIKKIINAPAHSKELFYKALHKKRTDRELRILGSFKYRTSSYLLQMHLSSVEQRIKPNSSHMFSFINMQLDNAVNHGLTDIQKKEALFYLKKVTKFKFKKRIQWGKSSSTMYGWFQKPLTKYKRTFTTENITKADYKYMKNQIEKFENMLALLPSNLENYAYYTVLLDEISTTSDYSALDHTMSKIDRFIAYEILHDLKEVIDGYKSLINIKEVNAELLAENLKRRIIFPHYTNLFGETCLLRDDFGNISYAGLTEKSLFSCLRETSHLFE